MASLTPQSVALQLALAEVDHALLERIDARFMEAGLVVQALAELQGTEPGWLARFTELDNATRDAATDPRVPRSVADMQERLAELALDPAACFVAIADETWVGYTLLDTAHSQPRVLRQSWTGVLPAWRRRGIASGLKLRAIRYALVHGYEALQTEARSTNEAILGLNGRLGFRPVAS